jgi:hypothetical protein
MRMPAVGLLVAGLLGLAPVAGAVPSTAAVVAAVPETCTVDAATLTWGFKESFRSYISGTIANGEWTVSDGATYRTPDFTFADGSGTWGAVLSQLSFEGAIRFTGHDGILDTTVANPQLEWTGTSGTLYLDVVGTTQAGDPVDQRSVAFADLSLPSPSGSGNARVFEDVGVTLTEDGAAAFGTYEAGEVFDPLALDLGVLDDGAAEHCGLLDAKPGPAWPVIIATAVGIVVFAITAAIVMLRRRRRATVVE